MKSAADRNLLFGFLALQLNFVSREALLAALGVWVCDKSRDLGEIFLQHQLLSVDRQALLEALSSEHLKAHGDDALQSLAALSAVGSIRHEVECLADSDLRATLAHLSVPLSAGEDEFATKEPSGDDHDSSGMPLTDTPTALGLRFRILRPHAKGGLGQVYLARDEELGREVALKVIQPRHADNPESRSRFLREAEVTGSLEHPGIVPVYGLGHYADGRPFYAMRFIKGDSLKEAIKQFHSTAKAGHDAGDRELQLRQMLGRFVDVCDAMEYAHSRGIMHRDLKPDNIMLGKFGETIVIDWGLAKTAEGQDVPGRTIEMPLPLSVTEDVAATLPGSTIGTPQYMSPEQAAGRLDLLGSASDVYSLGATLYSILTGRPPVEAFDVGEVLRRVQTGEIVAPRKIQTTIPRPLEAICLKAMALDPVGRYASPRTLANDIENWMAGEAVVAHREPLLGRILRWVRKRPDRGPKILAILVVNATVLPFWLMFEVAKLKLKSVAQDFGLETYQSVGLAAFIPKGWEEVLILPLYILAGILTLLSIALVPAEVCGLTCLALTRLIDYRLRLNPRVLKLAGRVGFFLGLIYGCYAGYVVVRAYFELFLKLSG